MKCLRTKLLRIYGFLFMGLAVSSCSDSVAGKPGVDETSNGLAVLVLDSVGEPVTAGEVRVRPADYLSKPAPAHTDSARGIHDLSIDSLGWLRVPVLPAGEYRVEIRCAGMGVQFAYVSDTTNSTGERKDTAQVAPLASVAGHVVLPPGVVQARIQVRGLDHTVLTNAQGDYVLDSLPAGDFQLQAIIPLADSVVLGQLTVELSAGEVLADQALLPPAEQLSTWAHALQVTLDPSAAGISLADSVRDFPLLLKLDGTRFPDSSVAGGADLRIIDAAGAPLAFELALWDSVARQARVWVHLPVVAPGSATQTLTVLWGRQWVSSYSSPSTAFDTATGWGAVWHLGGTYTDAAGQRRLRDATAFGYDPVLHGNWATVLGPLGNPTMTFDSVSFLAAPAPALNLGAQDVTLEMWVKTNVAGAGLLERSNRDTIWGRGEHRMYLGDTIGLSNNIGLYPTWLTWGNNYCRLRQQQPADAWAHLVLRKREVVPDTLEGQWFLNGEPVTTDNARFVMESDRAGDSLYLGASSIRKFIGSMQEVRISRVARTDEWIQLSHSVETSDGAEILSFRRIR